LGEFVSFCVVKNGGADIFRHIRRASLPWISPSSSTPPWRSNSRAHASSSTSSSSCSSFLNLSSTSNVHHHHQHADPEFASFNSSTLSFRLKIPVKRWNQFLFHGVVHKWRHNVNLLKKISFKDAFEYPAMFLKHFGV